MNNSLPIVSVVIGALVLLFGRKLFWLCVAAVGFAAGVELAPHLISQPSPLLQLSIALVLGFLGALLALLLQKVAIGLVGFAAGGRLAVGVAVSFLTDYARYYWLTFLIGGVIGAILLIALFDWALVLFSSLVGAHLIVRAFVLPTTGATILFIGLTVLGIVVQTTMLRRRPAVAD
ncbi:MAG: DUF4203 domain-containing protein [Verrucomicrobiota bacterium]|nr:DUF4203 domain-containing protein [Verrucomicrobiota bacterium]